MSYDTQKHNTIIELFKQGKSPAQIAEGFGVSRQRISQILKTRGVKSAEGGRAVRAARKLSANAEARIARHVQKFGCTPEQLATTLTGCGSKPPYHSFNQQRNHALRRGVPFRLTFWEWWCIWLDSGKWEKRGRSDSSFCMCRIGDEGAYESGNVYIASVIHNSTLGRTLAHEIAKQKTAFYAVVAAAGGRRAVAEELSLPPRYISQLANSGHIPASWAENGRARKISEMTLGAYSEEEICAMTMSAVAIHDAVLPAEESV